ncbi:glycosyltransferase family 10 domain-containing protein [Leisingera caerulea]|uniref:glycosyltransferase family 10 domain-containing protein n=1 Tax=Leisingera caerulea TaxID=506591 RepID=UPI0021A61C92|nr:glycosyltransferase family 10 [Leisingera caerulea]
MIKIYMAGRHIKRSAFSYTALAPLFSGWAERTLDPYQADLYLFAHILDIEEAPQAVVAAWRQRRRPIVLLSEEPFWDTIWGRRPLAPELIAETRFGAVPVIQLNHATSGIFRFARIPYYLLTNHRFANAYAARFARNAAWDEADWQACFEARSTDLTFMFERRPEPYHAVQWPEAGIIGLCSWRTELAEAVHGGAVERLGKSWQGGRSRFQQRNWYLDKITLLDRRARMLAAFENTHQPDYVTEKIFDAFACGSVPLYYAAPGHRIHEFGLPEDAWINLYGLSAREAVAQVEELGSGRSWVQGWGRKRFAAYARAQRRLAELFCDPALWVAERRRLAAAVKSALTGVLEAQPELNPAGNGLG